MKLVVTADLAAQQNFLQTPANNVNVILISRFSVWENQRAESCLIHGGEHFHHWTKIYTQGLVCVEIQNVHLLFRL